MTFLWKALVRERFGISLLGEVEGAHVALCDWAGLEVRYPRDASPFIVLDGRRWEGRRRSVRYYGRDGGGFVVTEISLNTPDGSLLWLSPDHVVAGTGEHPRGTLSISKGKSVMTGTRSGLFDAPGLVHAAPTWRDSQRKRGYAVEVEVDDSVDEALQPFFAALPLFFFTEPPTV